MTHFAAIAIRWPISEPNSELTWKSELTDRIIAFYLVFGFHSLHQPVLKGPAFLRRSALSITYQRHLEGQRAISHVTVTKCWGTHRVFQKKIGQFIWKLVWRGVSLWLFLVTDLVWIPWSVPGSEWCLTLRSNATFVHFCSSLKGQLNQ